MKLESKIIFYERSSASDGAGGRTPGVLTEVTWMWGNVKPLSGSMAMQFQSLTGTQGYEIWIRTDFEREPDRKYIIGYEGIYGNKTMVIQGIEIGKYYTKLICSDENKV